MQEDLLEKEELLEEIKEMLNIPQLERIIFHKINELKFFFREEVERYRNLKAKFRQEAYGDIHVLDTRLEVENEFQTYHFELNLNKKKQWIVSAIEPSPPPGYETEDIIPNEIIKYIASIEGNSSKIETQKNVSFPSIKGKRFDLSFMRYSNSLILGTIKGFNIPIDDVADTGPPDDLSDLYYNNQDNNDEKNFRDLIYFMQKYPSVKNYFFTELNMKMRPLIQGKIIEITSSSQPLDQF